MISVKLRVEAERFKDTLKYILNKSLDIDARFLEENLNNSILRIENKKPGFPLVRKCDDPSNPILFLHLIHAMGLDSSGRHLRTESSSISLQAKVKDGKNASPIVRVEYKRKRKRFPPAHMHVHANSPEIAWLYGTAGYPAPDLHALHFPVGGRRFRPTLEEFLFFLDDEGLFTDWKNTDWRDRLKTTLADWQRKQARSTVRTHPKEAAKELRTLGYVVTQPTLPTPLP